MQITIVVLSFRNFTLTSIVPFGGSTLNPGKSTILLTSYSTEMSQNTTIGVNRPAIVREIPHFGLFPAFLPEHPACLAIFRNNKNR